MAPTWRLHRVAELPFLKVSTGPTSCIIRFQNEFGFSTAETQRRRGGAEVSGIPAFERLFAPPFRLQRILCHAWQKEYLCETSASPRLRGEIFPNGGAK